ncbi:hypothetical protein PPYR_07094 [Photinus pyralis]|uniref:CHK kinase-like domain-containing protein n=2 Tax=Photinus pyralis TaxID=7054 RepID=A0A5N4APH4_PHOPY|nr:uncharacterized protein LOC116169950 [Photinus pyralis]KAB0799214.1 hypothetical protein PPYR_07094 [Photinus pyralis]
MDDCDKVVLNSKAQSLLNSLITNLGIENYTLNITRGNAKGDNYLGVIGKIHVKTEGATWNWIIKCAPEASQFRTTVPVAKVYQREVYVYEKILAEYQKFQEEKGVTTPFRSYAKYYTSLLEEPFETIILEDMKAVGYKLYNRQEPLDYHHALLAIREYGRFHAFSFAIRDQKPDLFHEFQQNVPEVFYDLLVNSESSRQLIQYQCNQIRDSISQIDSKRAYDNFSKFQDHMLELVKKLVTVEAAGPYAVISHGDCWINNFLFKYSKLQKSPTDMCLIDWQMARVGSPVLDLSCFLFTSTDKQLRDQHYDSLIKEYYDSLSSFLIELGSDPEVLFPFNILQEHLKIFSVYGLFMAIQSLYFMVSGEDEIPDVHNFTSEEEGMVQMKYVPKNIDRYTSRIRDVVVDFEKFGYNF